MGLFTNPLGHAGFPPATTGSTATVDTPYTQPSAVRAATLAEVEAGIINYAYVSPATFSGGSTADFASPPPIGSTTPNTGAFTTLSATTPIAVASGGTGAGTFTSHGVLLGNTTSAITATAAGTAGQVLTGSSGAPSFVTLVTANVVTNATATIALANNTTYLCTDASAVTATLPSVAGSVVGSWIRVVSLGAGGVTIAQNATQEIFQSASVHTTAGTGGSVALAEYNAIELLCVSSTNWVATSTNATLSYT